MRRFPAVLMGLIIVLPLFALSGFARQAGPEGRVPEKQAEAKLPPAVLQAIKTNCPGAAIDKMEMEKDAGIVLYDIEFKAGRGEIEVAEDGTVMDVAAVVDLRDVPGPAADAIRRAAIGATITQVEKSEVRAEIKTEGGRGRIVKIVPPKYVYEAELAKGELRGEVQVSPEGRILEGPKWGGEEAGKKFSEL
jgi:hypothetical protein